MKLYQILKLAVGFLALSLSYEYFFYIVKYPHNTYFYIRDIIFLFLFSAFTVGEAFIAITTRHIEDGGDSSA